MSPKPYYAPLPNRRLREWVSSWIETMRVAPPFSRRRRDLIALANEPFDPADWIEVGRPGEDHGHPVAPDANGCYGWPRACTHHDDLDCFTAEELS